MAEIEVINTFSQDEWERLATLMSLLDDPVFLEYVKWGISELEEKHGQEIVLLNMKEMHRRLHGR